MVRRSMVVAGAIVLALWPTTAGAQYRPAPRPALGPLPPLDAAGCYWYRGRQRCGRYCYYEVNGKRYCQRWERDAVPQGPVDLYPAEPSFK